VLEKAGVVFIPENGGGPGGEVEATKAIAFSSARSQSLRRHLGSSREREMSAMRVKQVYVNDAIIGEAQTWPDVDRLLLEKDVQFEVKPHAVEGPDAFILHGTPMISKSAEGKGPAGVVKSAEPKMSERAAAIVRGLVRTERTTKGVSSDQGMLRLECLSGGFYWISLDGGRLLRGAELIDAEELQAKFRDAMERAGR
jgi:hypothetical protein